jgi:hypothetical protein
MSAQAQVAKTTPASLGLEWKVLSSHELPGGALVWLRVSPSARDLAGAAAVRKMAFGETGVVARLRVQNPFSVDALLPSDLVLDGGKQARVVERSVIVAASSQVEIPVRCVEAGRWRARDAGTAASFELSSTVTGTTREAIAKMKKQSLQQRKGYVLDQNAMWSYVAAELDREEVSSETSSYTAVLGKRRFRVEQAQELNVKVPPNANGVAVVRKASGATWLEAFPGHDHVEAALTPMVADLLDEVALSTSTPAWPPRARAEQALAKLWMAAIVAMSVPEGTLGRAFAADADGVAGAVLVRDEHLVHFGVSVDL